MLASQRWTQNNLQKEQIKSDSETKWSIKFNDIGEYHQLISMKWKIFDEQIEKNNSCRIWEKNVQFEQKID